MIESLITISSVGLFTGFIFSIPVAGPISILITSNSLKGEFKYCVRAAVGASIVDFLYCFVAVFSFTQLYELYRPIIQYIFLVGAIFLFIIGIKIARTKLDISTLKKSEIKKAKRWEKGGFWTGFMLNLLNPSLFVGWMMSSFLVMTTVASLGFNTGGLESVLDNNIKAMNHIEERYNNHSNQPELPVIKKAVEKIDLNPDGKSKAKSVIYPVLLSSSYALFVSFGTIIWFYYFSKLIVKHRKKLKVNTINRIIQCLGILLCFFGFFLAYKALVGLIT